MTTSLTTLAVKFATEMKIYDYDVRATHRHTHKLMFGAAEEAFAFQPLYPVFWRAGLKAEKQVKRVQFSRQRTQGKQQTFIPVDTRPS